MYTPCIYQSARIILLSTSLRHGIHLTVVGVVVRNVFFMVRHTAKPNKNYSGESAGLDE